MNLMMVRAKIKEENVADALAATEKVQIPFRLSRFSARSSLNLGATVP